MLQVRLLGQFDVRADGKRIVISTRAAQSLFALLILNPGMPQRRERLAGVLWSDTTDEAARRNLRQELWRLRKALGTGTKRNHSTARADEYLVGDELTVVFNSDAPYWLDVTQLRQPAQDVQSLISNLSLYRGELLPGFYDDWVAMERDRVAQVFERKMQQLLELLVRDKDWTAVLEWGERWIALGETPESAYRALMLAYGAQGNSAQVALVYERCADALRNDLGVEPSAETRALFDEFTRGQAAPHPILEPLSPVLIQPSGTVTFLFSDIEGSTRLLERLGAEYANLLADHRDLLQMTAEKHNGHQVDSQGDAIFFAFFRAADAIAFAADAQRALASHTWQRGETLRVRMGLHTGEPMLARTGYVGMDVHRAARIGAAGHGGQILLSETTRALVANELPPGTRLDDLGEHRLKDLRYPVHIVQLTVEGLPSDFPSLKTLDTASEPPAPGEPPFKGLEFFDEQDADVFFGREELTTKLVDTLRAQNFLAVVVGASGSGKSSVVRAGLIPALRGTEGGRQGAGENWRVFVMTPTAHPLEALAIALTRASESVTATATLLDDLARDPRSLQLYLRKQSTDHRTQTTDPRALSSVPRSLVVVDQFEELFTLCRDDFEREQFIDNLLDAVETSADEEAGRSQVLTLVLTLRADFYAHLAQYPELRDAVAVHQTYIGPMGVEELRRAIEEPARQRHADDGGAWEFEPGLVDLILRDVGEEPGALPLLSHALLETWVQRSGHTMTLKGYADAGGVRGAIAHTAETTYAQLTTEQQTIARDIFVRLTELGEGTEDTRRRASLDELIPQGENGAVVRTVLTQLADARLITTGENSAEVAHEALIREWPRLREWLNENRDGLKLHRHLTEAAHEWELMERDLSMLYRGIRLAQAQEFASVNPNVLNAGERAFLDASVENERKEEREKQAQQQRELEQAQQLAAEQKARAEEYTRSNRRLRQRAMFLAGAFVLAILLAGIALFLGDQSNRHAAAAQQNAAQAETNANAAESARLQAEREERAAFGRALAASAITNLESDPERSILLALAAVKATAQDQIVLPEAQTALHQAVLSSRIQKTLAGHTGRVIKVAYSPDGTRLATNSTGGTIRLWEVATGKELLQLPIRAIGNLTFSDDGARLATVVAADDDKTAFAKIWDTRSGDLLSSTSLPFARDKWSLDAWNPDLSRVVVGDADGKATVWDIATGNLLLTLAGHDGWVNDVTYSPDGTRIVTVSDDKTAKVWDATTGQVLLTLCCHGGVANVTFSPDGTRIGTGSYDRTAKVWDAVTGKELFTLDSHLDYVSGISFSPDGMWIATNSYDQKAKVWDAKNGKELMTLAGHTGFGEDVEFSPDGKQLATTSWDGAAKIWNLAPVGEGVMMPSDGGLDPGFTTIAYSPDGTRLAAGLRNGGVQIWDPLSGKELLALHGHSQTTHRVAFSLDGTRLVSGSADKTAKLWDAVSGKELQTFRGHTGEVLAVAISSDGTRVATGSEDKTVKIWDALSGAQLATFPTEGAVASVAFSPDGSLLASANMEGDSAAKSGSIYIWNLTLGKLAFPPTDNVASTWIAFSPDGKRIASSRRDVMPKVFDAATGKEVLSLQGLTSIPLAIAYSADGKYLATANFDGTAIVFDAKSGRELFTINDKSQNGLGFVAFSPDGKHIALADVDTVRVYLAQIDDLVELAKSRLTRTWRQDECQKYLHVEQCPP